MKLRVKASIYPDKSKLLATDMSEEAVGFSDTQSKTKGSDLLLILIPSIF